MATPVNPLSTSTSLIHNVWLLNCALCSSSSFRPPQSDTTYPLFFSQNLIPSFSIPPFTGMQRLCIPHPQEGNPLCHTGFKVHSVRPYPPRNVSLPSTVAPCMFVGVHYSSTRLPPLLSTTLVSCHLSCRKTFQFASCSQVFNNCTYSKPPFNLLVNPRGGSRPPYMDFFLPICRCYDIHSYETPCIGGGDDILCQVFSSGHPFSDVIVSGRHSGTVFCFVWWWTLRRLSILYV